MKVKNIVFSGAMASILMIGAAVAADKTDLTFNGKYSLSDGTESSVSNEPVATNYGYTYTKSDGGTKTTTSSDEAPAQTDFTYKDKDDNTKSLADGTPVIGDYTGNTMAGTTGYEVVSTTQDVKAGATIDKANYSYTGGDGESASLGESANDMTDTVTLDSTYAASKEITITNGEADSFSGENYTWTNPDTGSVFHLNAEGDKLINADGGEETPTAGSAMETAFNAMKDAFTTDSGNVDSAKTTTGNQWTAEQANFAKANEVYSADSTTIGNLDTRWATVGTATTAYTTAQGKQTEAQGKLTTDHGLWSDASTLYNAPIYGTIDGEIDAALAEGGAINTAIAGEKNRATEAETSLSNRIDSNASQITTLIGGEDISGSVKNTVKTSIDAESSARESADTQIRAEFATADAATLSSAKTYADEGDADIKNSQLGNNINGLQSYMQTMGFKGADNVSSGEKATVENHLVTLAGAVETNKGAIADINNSDVMKSGITAEKVSKYDGYADLISTNADDILNLRSDVDANTSAISDLSASITAGDTKLRNDIAALDSKMNDLDESLSAGIASSVALSSVAVSNVKQGEMSVGGGYGNYNSKSAMAFGAALGITDNWSANAGVGFGFGKDTKASFRIGTNYKFKLF